MFEPRHCENPTALLEYLYQVEGEWKDLSFGIFGGLDIGCHCTVLRNHPIKLFVDFHRASIRQFCSYLQLPYFEHQVTDIQNLCNSLVPCINTYPKTLLCVEGEFYICVDNKARTVVSISDSKKLLPIDSIVQRKQRIYIIGMGASMDVSKSELLLLSLASSIAHYQNRTGVLQQVESWVHLLRRPSIRNSWPKLLQSKDNYFEMAIQFYRQIGADDFAFRERYVSFLRAVAIFMDKPELSRIALEFRHSAELWRRLGLALIDSDSPSMMAAQTTEDISLLLETFRSESLELDIPLRLQYIEKTIQQIFNTERKAFAAIHDVIAPMSIFLQS
jgi:hypothetical protein